jgi:hypothetical protein
MTGSSAIGEGVFKRMEPTRLFLLDRLGEARDDSIGRREK